MNNSSKKIMIKSSGNTKQADISSDLPLRKWLYSWLLDSTIENNYQKDVDYWISTLIILNLFVISNISS